MPRNCWTRCNKTFPCSFPAREKTREIESRETSRCLEKQAILALLRKMIYKIKFEEAVKMKGGKHPNTIHPITGYDKEIYVKPTITNPNIIVGDFTYIADLDFESHVSHLSEWNDDKLIIGKFGQIAAGVEFVMNGANHQMNAVSTFPFYTLEWKMLPPVKADMPLKGDI